MQVVQGRRGPVVEITVKSLFVVLKNLEYLKLAPFTFTAASMRGKPSFRWRMFLPIWVIRSLGGVLMQVVYKDKFSVVGIVITGKWDELATKMRAAWKTFFDQSSAILNTIGDYAFDISLAEDDGVYTQLICKEVSNIEEIPPGMVAKEIPPQAYIYHRHEGDVRQIAESFGKMYAWAVSEGYTVLDLKIDYGYTAQGDETVHDLFLAIKEPGDGPLASARYSTLG